MIQGLAALLDRSEAGFFVAIMVFTRVGAIVALLPGFGEQMIPARVRLGITVAFTMVVWPMVLAQAPAAEAGRDMLRMMLIEAAIGLLLGLSIRLMVFALQFAGSVIAQSTALTQIFGAGVAPDPMPAIGSILMLTGVTLAVAAGLHVKVAILMARSYEILPMGLMPAGSDVAAWATERIASAFALGFSLSAPFVIAAFAYNLALGAINRAMPQLMVAFIGAPAITAGGLLLLILASPVMLHYWQGRLDATLADPLSVLR